MAEEAIIYLFRQLPAGINLPTLRPLPARQENGRVTLYGRYTWHFSMQGLPGNTVTRNTRELLPHIFTLIPQQSCGTVIFCGTVCSPASGGRPGYSPVQRSVLSGLSSPAKAEAIARFVVGQRYKTGRFARPISLPALKAYLSTPHPHTFRSACHAVTLRNFFYQWSTRNSYELI